MNDGTTAPKPVRELPPQGTFRATVYRVVYLGTIKTEYKGEIKFVPKVDITWELNDETKVWKEGEPAKPQVVSKEFSFSMGDKSKLKPIIEGIIGKGLSQDEAYAFKIEDLLGMSSQLSIKHGVSETGKPKFEVTTSPYLKGTEKPIPFNEPKLLTYKKWSQDVFDSLPTFMKEKMMETEEYELTITNKGKKTATPIEYPQEDIDSGDIPF